MENNIMKSNVPFLLAVFVLSIFAHLDVMQAALPKSNEVITFNSTNVKFGTTFYVLYRPDNPCMELRNLPECRYFAPTWKVRDDIADGKTITKSSVQGGDGFDNRISLSLKGRTYDYFHSSEILKLECTDFHKEGHTYVFDYITNDLGKLKVKAFKVDDRKWTVTYSFKALKAGYYSVLYMGAPSCAKESVDFIFQPMVWQQRRFPMRSYVSLAYSCSLPAAFLSSNATSWGVVVSPEEFPFLPLPERDNNRFGVLTKDDEGNFRPMLTAPVMGSVDSHMKAEDIYDFNFYLFSMNEQPIDTYESIARNIYQFKDYRSNDICNLNHTIDNINNYILSKYSCFIDSLKGCSYSTDVLGSVNNSTSLNPISIALLSDNMEMIKKRALPILEYMLSRQRSLFCLDKQMKIQNPTRALGGPCATLNEMLGLQYFSSVKHSLYEQKVEQQAYRKTTISWSNYIDSYKATGKAEYLKKAIAGADTYLNEILPTQSTSLEKKGFWPSYNPDFKSLLNLYEITGEQRFLEAARIGARLYAMYIWMCPVIPNQKVLVNKGGVAPHYWYLKAKGFPQMPATERYVDAWRLSEMGLLSESSMTSIGHRAVFTAHHAPYMYKIAHYTGDEFLRDIARSAVAGRYRNFPGYHINTERTDVYEQKDYPLHEWKELSVNSLHYNHPLPMLSMLYDYLITDFWHKTDEAVSFPSFHTEAHAYLQSELYGKEAGNFYDYNHVSLWMPQHVLSGVDNELNYLMGIDGKNLYVSFSNQSKEKVLSTVTFDDKRVLLDPNREYEVEVIDAHGAKHSATLNHGALSVEVGPMGVRSYVIKNIDVKVDLHNKFFSTVNRWGKGGAAKGKYSGAHAYVIDFGEDLKETFVYIEDDDSKVSSVTFDVRFDGKSFTYEDKYYPFEYTCPILNETKRVDCCIHINYINGQSTSQTLKLRR